MEKKQRKEEYVSYNTRVFTRNGNEKKKGIERPFCCYGKCMLRFADIEEYHNHFRSCINRKDEK